jgi:hypothetical protein
MREFQAKQTAVETNNMFRSGRAYLAISHSYLFLALFKDAVSVADVNANYWLEWS